MKRRTPRTSLRRAARKAAAGLCAALLAGGGCGAGDTSDHSAEAQAEAATVSRTAQEGPVSLTLTASPGELEFSTGSRAAVTVEVLAEVGVTLTDRPGGDVGDYGQTLREGDRRFEYRVVRSEKRLAEPAPGGKVRWTYRFELAFFLPGEYELPSVSVAFVDMRAAEGQPDTDAPAEVREVSTKPLTLIVHAPTGAAFGAEELSKIPQLAPIELPSAWSRLWWLAPVFATVLAVMAGLIVHRLRARRVERVAIVPPHEWARNRLAELIAEDLVGKGLIQEFHYRVSDIVRGYIERRFAMCAPEMTTEEFLTVAAKDSRFTVHLPSERPIPPERPGRRVARVSDSLPVHLRYTEQHGQTSSPMAPALPGPSRGDTRETITAELQRFLTACDLVKYARYEPTRTACDAVLRTAFGFVERTREVRRALTQPGVVSI